MDLGHVDQRPTGIRLLFLQRHTRQIFTALSCMLVPFPDDVITSQAEQKRVLTHHSAALPQKPVELVQRVCDGKQPDRLCLCP